MNQKIQLFWILGLFLIPLASASGIDFVGEFSVQGETCEILDNHFRYFLNDGTESIAILYECCKGNSCIMLPFDLTSETPYSRQDNQELFNSLYVLDSINEGKISKNVFSYKEFFDLCDYFGSDKLAEQTVSLSTKGYEVVKSELSKENKAILSGVKNIFKGIGWIKKINPVDFAGSAVCYNLDGAERKAFEQLLVCNENLNLLSSGVSYNGIIQNMKDCNAKARAEIVAIMDSPVQKGKHWISKTGNVVAEVGDYLKHINEKDNTFEVRDTPYEQLEDSLQKINKEDPLLSKEDSSKLASNALARFQFKNDEVREKISIINSKIANISEIKPHPITIFIKNVFQEPNFNSSKIDYQDNLVDTKLTGFNVLYDSSKYNSAIANSKEIIEDLDTYSALLTEENNIPRKFDWRWYLVPAILILVTGFVFYRTYKY